MRWASPLMPASERMMSWMDLVKVVMDMGNAFFLGVLVGAGVGHKCPTYGGGGLTLLKPAAFRLPFIVYFASLNPRFKCTISSATAAGVTPEMRDACPSVSGWCWLSFCCTSADKPLTLA